jgi:hypothetical protein
MALSALMNQLRPSRRGAAPTWALEHPVPQDPDRLPSKPNDPPAEGGEDEG